MHAALRIGVVAAIAGSLLWTVKPAQSGVPGFSIQQLIAAAYHVYDYQVSGGPKWILGRPVVDQTAISGPLDYKLEWAPDGLQLRSDESPVPVRAPCLRSAA